VDGQSPSDARLQLQLSGRQSDLAEALSEKDPRLAAMYLGALRALDASGNPDAPAQACHSLRELMEKIPRWYPSVAVPAPEQLSRMDDKVRALAGKWKRMREKTRCLNNGAWGGSIDGDLTAALKEADDLFAWLETDRPFRRQRTTEMFRTLDPMGLPLPPKVERVRVDEWSWCRDYFVKAAHHDITATHEDVSKRLHFLEGFLLDLIRPRTFEKHADIDAIVEKGESGADPR
jgi:hypothetical protein